MGYTVLNGRFCHASISGSTRGAYLEKLLIEPDLFTDEDVFAFLDYALNTLYAKSRLNATLEAKRKEVMQNHGDEAFQAGEKAAETRTG
jgi:hypothetical protein